MKKSTLPLIIALTLPLAPGSAPAQETAYVSSDLAISLRKTADPNSPTLRGLKSGTRFTIIEGDKGNGFAHIRADDGTEGWIQSRHISRSPNQLQQQLDEAQSTIAELQAKLDEARNSATPQPAELATPPTPQTTEGDAALLEENGVLKARIAELESTLQALPAQDESLKIADADGARHWFMTGAGVILLGVVIGLIIPRLGWRKRSGWGDL